VSDYSLYFSSQCVRRSVTDYLKMIILTFVGIIILVGCAGQQVVKNESKYLQFRHPIGNDVILQVKLGNEKWCQLGLGEIAKVAMADKKFENNSAMRDAILSSLICSSISMSESLPYIASQSVKELGTIDVEFSSMEFCESFAKTSVNSIPCHHKSVTVAPIVHNKALDANAAFGEVISTGPSRLIIHHTTRPSVVKEEYDTNTIDISTIKVGDKVYIEYIDGKPRILKSIEKQN
jgi:hypothetical protein